MADININVTGNISVLRDAMEQARQVVSGVAASIRTSVAGIPEATSLAVSDAGAALASLSPKLNAQAAAILDMKAALAQANAALRETEKTVIESGGAINVERSLIEQYNIEQLASLDIERRLSAAKIAYKATLLEVATAQQAVAEAQAEATIAVEREAAAYDRLTAALVASLGPESAQIARTMPRGEETLDAGAVSGAGFGYAAGAESAKGASEQAIAADEAVVAATEAATAAKDAQTAAVDAENAATERETESKGTSTEATRVSTEGTAAAATAEQNLVDQTLAHTVAQNAELAGTEAGMAALREHAEATAQVTMARRALNAATVPSVELENLVTAANERQTAALRNLAGMQAAQTRAANEQSGALGAMARTATVASDSYMALAKATVANIQAQQELRAVQELAVATGGAEEKIMADLAIAQEAAAASAAELSVAQKALAGATDVASESQSLFRARLVTSEYGIRAFFTTAITSIPVLIGVVAAGFGVRMIEAIQKSEMALVDLSVMMNISIRDLADMGLAAEAMGAKTDDMTAAMKRLDRVISDAFTGSKNAQMTLQQLGIDIESLRTAANPTSMAIAQMSDYMRANAGNVEVMRAATRALGSDSVALAAYFAQGAQATKLQSEQYADYGTAAQNAEAAARSLQQTESRLSAIWGEIKLKIMGATVAVIDHGGAYLNMATGGALGAVNDSLIAWWNLYTQGIDLATEAIMRNGKARAELTPAEVTKDLGKDAAALTVPPKPPVGWDTETQKVSKPKAEKSDLSLFREELDQKIALFEGTHAQLILMEEEYWNKLISTGRVKGRDVIAVETEIAKARIAFRKEAVNDIAQEQKTAAVIVRIREEEDEFFAKSNERRVRDEIRVLGEKLKANMAYHAEIMKLTQDVSINNITRQEEEVKKEADAGKRKKEGRWDIGMSRPGQNLAIDQKEVEDLKKLEDEKWRIRQEDIQRQKDLVLDVGPNAMSTMPGDKNMQRQAATAAADDAQLTDLVKLDAKLEAEKRQHEQRMAQLEKQGTDAQQKAIDDMVKDVDKVFAPLDKAMDGMVKGVLMGTQTIGQAFKKIWNDIVLTTTEALAKMLLQHVKHSIAEIILHHTTQQAKTAGTAAGAGQRGIIEDLALVKTIARHAIEIGSHILKEIIKTTATVAGVIAREAVEIAAHFRKALRDAEEAAMGAFNSVMSAVPFPANVVLAPAAAAAAFTGVMALASAAGGMEVPHDMIAKVHENEMVLPANISNGLKAMITGDSNENGSNNHNNNTTFGDINFEQHNHHPVATSVGPDQIAKLVKRKLEKRIGVRL